MWDLVNGTNNHVLTTIFGFFDYVQYVAHMVHSGKSIFEKFSVLISIAIVWIYAHLLTVGGAYNHTPPKTQASCRTDRAGLIDGAPWLVA